MKAKMIVRYIIFSAPMGTPNGGWDDYVGGENDLDGAKAAADEIVQKARCSTPKWAHVVDLTSGRVVYRKMIEWK